jgi:hypothetical protein
MTLNVQDIKRPRYEPDGLPGRLDLREGSRVEPRPTATGRNCSSNFGTAVLV